MAPWSSRSAQRPRIPTGPLRVTNRLLPAHGLKPQSGHGRVARPTPHAEHGRRGHATRPSGDHWSAIVLRRAPTWLTVRPAATALATGIPSAGTAIIARCAALGTRITTTRRRLAATASAPCAVRWWFGSPSTTRGVATPRVTPGVPSAVPAARFTTRRRTRPSARHAATSTIVRVRTVRVRTAATWWRRGPVHPRPLPRAASTGALARLVSEPAVGVARRAFPRRLVGPHLRIGVAFPP